MTATIARLRRDDGAGTVLALTMTTALIVVTVALLSAGSLAVARQHAASAADQAALAASQFADCDQADRLARENGATLVDCQMDDTDAVVVVAVPMPRAVERLAAWPGGAGSAPSQVRATARAGLIE